jgi:acetoin utilization deacetylase AcuC-like enzyme
MISLFHEGHRAHAPALEMYRGDRTACLENPQRADFVRTSLIAGGHEIRSPFADSQPDLEGVHTARYLRFLQGAWADWLQPDPARADIQPWPSVWPVRTLRSDREPANFQARLGLYSMDNGCSLSAGTWTAAKGAADASASAAVLLQSGTRAVFCCTRPPGHHAGADFMGGYCFLNNAAVAAQALRRGGAARVAILDVDYHHGNGTQSIFYDRADVQFISLHGDPRTEYPFYLGHADETGAGAGLGFNLNLPLPARSPVTVWFEGLAAACQRIRHFGAEALVVSLGLDTYADDPICTFSLRGDDYRRLGRQLAGLHLPVIFVLEGGYAAAELGTNTVSVLDGFEQS